MSKESFPVVTFIVALLIPPVGSLGHADTAEAQDSPNRVQATAWPGLDSTEIGQFYDVNFQPLRSTVLPEGAAPRVVSVVRTYRTEERLMSRTAVQAQVQAWNLSASASSSASYGFVRSTLMRRVDQLPANVSFERAPARAAYVVSKIYYGYMYEARASGSASAVAAEINVLIGSVRVEDARERASVNTLSIGLEPKAGLGIQALRASNESEIGENFVLSGDPNPIIIEFEAITRDAETADTAAPPSSGSGVVAAATTAPASRQAPRYQIAVVAMSFPPRKPNSDPWDPLGGLPDMRVTFVQDGEIILVVDDPQRDRSQCRFSEARPFPRVVRIDANHPLVARFVDIDLSQNDDAGTATKSELVTGSEVLMTASTGAAVTLSVSRLD